MQPSHQSRALPEAPPVARRPARNAGPRHAGFRRARGLVAVAVLLVAPLAACGDDASNEVAIAEDATPEELMTELRGIQQELGAIQEQAMQDPALQGGRDSLEARLEDEIDELDPEAEAKRERAEEIATEFETVREAGDEEGARELAMESQELQASLQATQQRALETEEMTAAIAAFQERMLEAMNEVDPRTDSLVARAEAIVAHLQEEMARQQAAPRPEGAPEQAPSPEATPDTIP